MLPLWSETCVNDGRKLGFGVGVWRSALGECALAVSGGLLVAFGVAGVLWLAFPMSSPEEMIQGTMLVNDIGHIVLSAVTVLLILSQLDGGERLVGQRASVWTWSG